MANGQLVDGQEKRKINALIFFGAGHGNKSILKIISNQSLGRYLAKKKKKKLSQILHVATLLAS